MKAENFRAAAPPYWKKPVEVVWEFGMDAPWTNRGGSTKLLYKMDLALAKLQHKDTNKLGDNHQNIQITLMEKPAVT